MATLPGPGTQVLEDTGTDSQVEPPYHLILLDDDYHTYQYVIAMLHAVFGYSSREGVRDRLRRWICQGQAIVMTASKDQVSLKQQQIHAYGADPRMETSAGSMSAVIEPAC